MLRILLEICIFFFHRYGYHRDLHSFPTRRSSDLRMPRAASVRPLRRSATPSRSVAAGCLGTTLRISVACSRSEEHTSELQSLTNLVCRLLLEKKNEYSLREIHKPNSSLSLCCSMI